jgi:hypothetical protein
MKLSNLMIVILSIILSAYAVIAAMERRGPNNQGWRDIQLKSIGRNRFLLRRLDPRAGGRIPEGAGPCEGC